MTRYYIVQKTTNGFRALPYTEKGFPNRTAAYRYMIKNGDGNCFTSRREASQQEEGVEQ